MNPAGGQPSQQQVAYQQVPSQLPSRQQAYQQVPSQLHALEELLHEQSDFDVRAVT
jgi:hypothetical protein